MASKEYEHKSTCYDILPTFHRDALRTDGRRPAEGLASKTKQNACTRGICNGCKT